MKKQEHIGEPALDELLRNLYLDENSRDLNEPEAAFVLAQDYDVSIDPGKEQALLKRLKAGSRNKPGTRFYLLLAAIITIGILLLLWYLAGSGPIAVAGSAISTDRTETTVTGNNDIANKAMMTETGEHSGKPVKAPDTFGRPKLVIHVSHHDSTGSKMMAAGTREEHAAVPYLAGKDRIRYQNIKEQMIRKLIQSDKDLYTCVPANKMTYAGKPLVYDAFRIRNVQITNLEYKTFLADLLAQNRDQDYLAARAFPENWAAYGYTNLAELYFQNEAYNDFPVVTITTEGAVLFCKWLEEETAHFIKQHHLKTKPLRIRLPYDEDWIAAAREGYAKIAYEKGYNTLYDETENLVDGSFARRIELVKKRMKRVDSLYPVFTANRYGLGEKELMAFFTKGMTYYNGIQTDTIYTPRMKVLGKTGRVSEIVLQKGSSKIWLAGLSWKSRPNYQKLENEFNTQGLSPFVGFRIVVIDPDDPDYKSPFW
jgi:hypothetical protein